MKKLFTGFVAFLMLAGSLAMALAQNDEDYYDMPTEEAPALTSFTVFNPYENVDWETYGQYRAALHVHTNHSDGNATVAETVRRHQALGFNVLAITDHDVLNERWDMRGGFSMRHRVLSLRRFFSRREPMTMEEIAEANAAGLIGIPNTIEHSRVSHVNTFWAPFNNTYRGTVESVLRRTTELGGVAILNHPGRYTDGRQGGERGAAASNDPENIARYVNWLLEFDVVLGLEVFNRLDRESNSDRILWDNVLMELMPYNRSVWGFSNDDSHSINCVGYNFNVMLMPELTEGAMRNAMESGAFYAVARVARREGVNADLPERGSEDTLFLLEQPVPAIDDISVVGDAIAITGRDYDRVEWIADGVVIYTGAVLNLIEHADSIGHNYVRAQLVSETGIAMTQPFGVWEEGETPGARPVVVTTDNLRLPVWMIVVPVAVAVLVVAGVILVIKRRKKK